LALQVLEMAAVHGTEVATVCILPSIQFLEQVMSVAKLFSYGGSQAVRLPKEFRFEGTEVHVRRVGHEVVLSAQPPADLQSLLDAREGSEPGLRLERAQPAAQRRVAIEPRR
jgi:antitoxin VapB